MSEKQPGKDIAFGELKSFFRGTKDLNEFDPELLADLSLNEIQAIIFRRIAHERHNDTDPTLSHRARERSRLLLENPTDATDLIDPEIMAWLLDTENTTPINYPQIIEFLHKRGITHLPVLSTTPQSILDQLNMNHDFTFHTIPVDQLGLTDFEHVLRESPVPGWFKAEQTKRRSEPKMVELGQAIRERWFLLLVILLGITAGIGFTADIGLRFNDVISNADFYLSVYGAVAVGRSLWQTSRAERWNRTARHEVRSEYENSLENIVSEITDPELRAAVINDPAIHTLFKNISRASNKSNPWDKYRQKMGLNHEDNKAGYIDELIGHINRHTARINEQRNAGADKPGLRSLDRYSVVEQMTGDMLHRQFGEHIPSLAIVIPTYQTSYEEMRRLLVSIKNQHYPITNAYVVFNDDPNQTENKRQEFLRIQTLVSEMNATASDNPINQCRIHLLAQPSRGKREAMGMGFAMGRGRQFVKDMEEKYPDVPSDDFRFMIANLDLESIPDFSHDFVLNIDSDTEIGDPYAVLNSAIFMNKHPNAACTTGDVRVVNRNVNLLSEMTYQRYWRAFFVERAAQAPEVTCMSGPWVFMRGEALGSILDEWYFQEFLGQRSTYGDDRNLSTRFLENGWESLFIPDSFVLTDCPTDWKTFLKQQLRWNKSFNRENLILFAFIHRLQKYVQFDVVYQQTFPFIMLYILSNISLRAIDIGFDQGLAAGLQSVMPYAAAVLAYNEIFFGAYGAIKNQDPNYFKSPVYIYYHFRHLLWLKLEAIFRMKDTSWGTKGAEFDKLTAEEQQKIANQMATEIEAEIEDMFQEVEGRADEVQHGEFRAFHVSSDEISRQEFPPEEYPDNDENDDTQSTEGF